MVMLSLHYLGWGFVSISMLFLLPWVTAALDTLGGLLVGDRFTGMDDIPSWETVQVTVMGAALLGIGLCILLYERQLRGAWPY